jgi:hypothetical protein
MAYDGSGNFSPAAAPNFPAVGGATISSTYYNAVINDLATNGLSLALTRDGQGKPSANIDWNAKNLTNVAAFAAASASFTAALPVASGGTGLTTVPTNGQLLIGNGTNYTLATLTDGAGISITEGAGTITVTCTALGTVTSIDASGGATGFAFTGGPVTGSGTLTLTVSNAATIRTQIGLGSIATVAEATTAEYRANTADRALTTDQVWAAGAEVGLTDAATIALDMATFINGSVTLAGNRTLGNPTNTKDGQSGRIRFVQDGTGTRTLAYSSNWEFAGGTAPVLSTAAGSNDVLYYDVISSTRILGNLIKAIA